MHSPVAVDVISHFQLTTQNGNSLASALNGSTGILVKDYGGLSALKTLSMRGTGAEHTLILLDGVRYNSLQTGIVDIGMVPMESAERIEIVRGGNSAMYGADALGGVVNVTTLSPPSISGAEASASFGSFGYNRYAVQAHTQPFEGLQFLLGGSEEKSDGDFPFIDARQSPAVFQRRGNADLFTKRLYGKLRWKMMENMASQVFVSHYTTARGAPGPLVGSSQGTARQNDQLLDILGSVTHEVSSRWRYQVSSGFQSAYERYYDAQGVQSVDNYYKTAMMNIVADVRHLVSDDALGIGGFDAGYAVAD